MNQDRLLWAVDLAISGRKHLLSMWEGKYGESHNDKTRKGMIAEYTKDISELRDMKRELKCRN